MTRATALNLLTNDGWGTEMTVGELRAILNDFDDAHDVVIQEGDTLKEVDRVDLVMENGAVTIFTGGAS